MSWREGGQRGGQGRGTGLTEEAPRSVGSGQLLATPQHVVSLTQPCDSWLILAQLLEPQARGRIF